MKTITTSITLPHTPEEVWTVLTNFDEFTIWNPFIISSQGQPIKGSRLKNTMVLPNKKPMKFSPIILEVVERQKLHWLGRTFIPGLFDGKHTFTLEPCNVNETNLIQQESFSGILTYIMGKKFWHNVETAFNNMNQALASRLAVLYQP